VNKETLLQVLIVGGLVGTMGSLDPFMCQKELIDVVSIPPEQSSYKVVTIPNETIDRATTCWEMSLTWNFLGF